MNQNHLSRRKVMQLMSLTFLGSLAIPKVTYSMTNHNDFFDEDQLSIPFRAPKLMFGGILLAVR